MKTPTVRIGEHIASEVNVHWRPETGKLIIDTMRSDTLSFSVALTVPEILKLKRFLNENFPE